MISTRRSWNQAGSGATFQSPSRTCIQGPAPGATAQLGGGGSDESRRSLARPVHGWMQPLARRCARSPRVRGNSGTAGPAVLARLPFSPSSFRVGSAACRRRHTWPAARGGAPAARSPCRRGGPADWKTRMSRQEGGRRWGSPRAAPHEPGGSGRWAMSTQRSGMAAFQTQRVRTQVACAAHRPLYLRESLATKFSASLRAGRQTDVTAGKT